MVSISKVSKEYPTKEVLDGVSLGVFEGDRIGIVGANGDGKSTLLGVIAGNIEADAGQVIRNGSPRIGMLGQRESLDMSSTVKELLDSSIEIPWEADRRSREIVDALIADTAPEAQLSSLSGGQLRRVDLCLLLLQSWDMLLLDEPTNHLDIETINWLAQHLKARWPSDRGALLVVSHDRWFLDEVCTSMWEVHACQVNQFEGGYSAYILQRVERARLEELAKRKRENQLRKELAWLSRGAQARRSKPKFHLEQAAELIANVPPIRNPIELKQAAMTRLGKQVIDLEGVSLVLGNQTILEDVTWSLGPGERIGILGKNGAGKTSLLKLLDKRLEPSSGQIRFGKTVQLASLSQNLAELEPVANDVVRTICTRYKASYEVDGKLYSPTALLERLGFSRDELNMRAGELSGGQKRRFQLMLTLLEQPNVLFLDEPGNDLDTDMMTAMEDLLDSWPGTLVVVSHDRHLLERVCDDLFAIVDARFTHLPGGVDQYLDLVANQSAETSPKVVAQDQPQSGPSGNARAYELRKQLKSLERKMSSQQVRVDDARKALEACDPYDYESLGKCQIVLDAAYKKLSELEDEWLETSIELQ